MLKLDKVTKDYGNGKGIFNVSFQVKKGKICGVLGSNGCGKTTTFRILLGLLKLDAGSITYEKEMIQNGYRLFGYVPEERSMLRNLTLREQVFYLARLKKMEEQEIEESFLYWCSFFHIENYENTKIAELSKGNQQKVQMICALIHHPEIIIFDEPLNGLDVLNVELFKLLLMKLRNEKKIVLISSHQYHNIEHFCDQMIYLKEGKILFKGDINKLKLKKQQRFIHIHSKKDICTKEKGVISMRREKEYLILEVENKQVGYAIIKQLIEKEIDDFEMRLISLQDIIKEKSK